MRNHFGPGNSTDARTVDSARTRCAYNDSVIVTTAAFVVAYTAVSPNGTTPPLPDDVFTTWPVSPLRDHRAARTP